MPKTEGNPGLKRRSYQFYLGVDGGGTKTSIALMNEAREVVAEGSGGPSNPLRVGVETAVANIAKAFDAACDAGGISRGDVVAATLGLAGVRRQDLRERVRESFVSRYRIKRTYIMTDADIALYGTTQGKAGLVVIAGTGSICLGINDNGDKATAGGWGPVAGDEGGGRGIAGEALHRVAFVHPTLRT
jgi:N-acetylglucosamine kinase-like BadF-type ATPase